MAFFYVYEVGYMLVLALVGLSFFVGTWPGMSKWLKVGTPHVSNVCIVAKYEILLQVLPVVLQLARGASFVADLKGVA